MQQTGPVERERIRVCDPGRAKYHLLLYAMLFLYCDKAYLLTGLDLTMSWCSNNCFKTTFSITFDKNDRFETGQ